MSRNRASHSPPRMNDIDWTAWRARHEAQVAADKTLCVFLVSVINPVVTKGVVRLVTPGSPMVLVGTKLKTLDVLKARYRGKTGVWVGSPLLRDLLKMPNRLPLPVYEVYVTEPLSVDTLMTLGGYEQLETLKATWLSIDADSEYAVPIPDAQLVSTVSPLIERYYKACEDKALRDWGQVHGSAPYVAR